MIGLVSLSESPAALIEPWVSVKYELRREKKREEDEMGDRRGQGGGKRRRRERRERGGEWREDEEGVRGENQNQYCFNKLLNHLSVD